MKIKYFICALAVLTGSLQAVGQTYSGSFHCKPSPGSVAKGDVDVTAELTVKNGVAQMRRSSVKYEELLEGRVRGTSLNLEGQGHFFDRLNPWTTRLKGSLQGNTYRAQGEIINSKGETTRICEANLQSVEAPAVSSTAVSASFDCQKASSPAEQAICNSPQLAALDISLAEAYKIAFAQATDKVALKQGQNDWRKNERDRCTTEQCLRDAYQNRLNNLRQPPVEMVQPSASQEVQPLARVTPSVLTPNTTQASRPTDTPSAPTKIVEAAAIPTSITVEQAKDQPSAIPTTPSEINIPQANQTSVVESSMKTAPELNQTTNQFTLPFSLWQMIVGAVVALIALVSGLLLLGRKKNKSSVGTDIGIVKKGTEQTVLPIDVQHSPNQNQIYQVVFKVAKKYKTTLEEAGLLCEVDAIQAPEISLDIDLPISDTTIGSAMVTQAAALSTMKVVPATDKSPSLEVVRNNQPELIGTNVEPKLLTEQSNLCPKCSSPVIAMAAFCGECGQGLVKSQKTDSPKRPTETPHTPEVVTDKWKEKFALIERAGGVKMLKIRDLSSKEQRKVMTNMLGFIFGPFYYLAKGMYKKAAVLVLIVIPLIFLFELIPTMGQFNPSKFSWLISSAIFATRANIDYYKKVVLGQNGWW